MSYILLIFAAFFNAVMDTLAHHYSTSVFKNKDQEFWNPNVSWKFAKFLPYTKYRVDAWHLSKSMMIFSMCFAIVFYKVVFYNCWIDFILLGCTWNVVFNYSYDVILKDA